MPVIPAEPWSSVAPRVQTGDLLLFSGSSPESVGIETVFGSKYSHVGMLVRHGDDLWIWQTGPDPISKDPETGTMHGGAQLGEAEATFTVMNGYGDAPSWRQLDLERDAAFEAKVVEAIGTIEGTPFPSMAAMVGHYLEGRAGIQDQSGTFFCAELVARTYQEIGLLGEQPYANWYSPKSFSAEDESPALLMGARFETEVPLSF